MALKNKLNITDSSELARFSLKVAYQLGGLLAVISAPDKVGQYLNRVGVIPEFEP
ncbi:MAG: hypothetical protein KH006_03825 [Firmicutes bacterium]|nr:hypothetical protein [Bacillota bacterium]